MNNDKTNISTNGIVNNIPTIEIDEPGDFFKLQVQKFKKFLNEINNTGANPLVSEKNYHEIMMFNAYAEEIFRGTNIVLKEALKDMVVEDQKNELGCHIDKITDRGAEAALVDFPIVDNENVQ